MGTVVVAGQDVLVTRRMQAQAKRLLDTDVKVTALRAAEPQPKTQQHWQWEQTMNEARRALSRELGALNRMLGIDTERWGLVGSMFPIAHDILRAEPTRVWPRFAHGRVPAAR
jgi:hypothetical protein